jgi:hypothetical protein
LAPDKKAWGLKHFLAVVGLVELVGGVKLGNEQVEGGEVEILPMETLGDSGVSSQPLGHSYTQSTLHAVELFTREILVDNEAVEGGDNDAPVEGGRALPCVLSGYWPTREDFPVAPSKLY